MIKTGENILRGGGKLTETAAFAAISRTFLQEHTRQNNTLSSALPSAMPHRSALRIAEDLFISYPLSLLLVAIQLALAIEMVCNNHSYAEPFLKGE